MILKIKYKKVRLIKEKEYKYILNFWLRGRFFKFESKWRKLIKGK